MVLKLYVRVIPPELVNRELDPTLWPCDGGNLGRGPTFCLLNMFPSDAHDELWGSYLVNHCSKGPNFSILGEAALFYALSSNKTKPHQ